MNEVKENKGSGLKYFLFIGIPVIIILGVLGVYYHLTNPLNVLTNTINTAYESMDKLIQEEEQNFNILENPTQIIGNLKFNTNANLNGLEELQDYNYDFNLGLDYKQKQIKLGLGINKDSSKIIDGTIYLLNDKQYLESSKIFNGLVNLSNSEPTNPFDTLIIENDFNINGKEAKIILKKLKEIFVESLDSKYLSREKADITIDNDTIKTTKITYLLNEENQKRTINFMAEKMKNDKELVENLAKVLNKTQEEILEDLKQTQENYEFQEEIKLILYAEGLKQNVIRISTMKNSEEILNFIHYKNKNTLTIENDVTFTFNTIEENKIDLDFIIKDENINGKIKVETTEEMAGNLFLSIKSPEINLDLDMDLAIKINEQLEIPSTANAKRFEEFTNEELVEILTNLEQALEGTIFYNLLESNIM